MDFSTVHKDVKEYKHMAKTEVRGKQEDASNVEVWITKLLLVKILVKKNEKNAWVISVNGDVQGIFIPCYVNGAPIKPLEEFHLIEILANCGEIHIFF